MENPKSASAQFDFTNIQNVLITQLNKSRQQSPESFSKEIYVLPGINDETEGELEEQLQQEREDHRGKRILLIPYCLKNSHWTGVLIEFHSAEQISRAEYIDPVDGYNTVPDRLREQLTRVYPSAILQLKDIHKNVDLRFSSALTVKNLLTAVENNQRSNFDNPESDRTIDSSLNTDDTKGYSVESQQSSWQSSQSSIQTPIPVREEGNSYTLTEKQQELNRGLEKLKIRNIDALPQKIQKTEERIREYGEDERTDDVEKETAILKELHRLQNLANEIATPTLTQSTSDDDIQLKLRQMKEELSNQLEKLKIRDESVLLQKIQKTEERIREYEEEERIDDVERETAYLRDFQRLQSLANEIARLSQESFTSQYRDHSKLLQMNEELTNSFAKFKIRDEAMLLQKVQKTEDRIREYEEEERAEDVEKERNILKELQRLQNLLSEIARLTTELPKPHDDVQLKVCRMEEEVRNGLAKLKIRDEAMLFQKIQKTEDRIREYEEEERAEDVEKERNILKELQRLQNLLSEIARLTSQSYTLVDGAQLKVPQKKKELDNGLKKLKIRDVDMLLQKIQKTEQRIKDYEDEERTEDVEKEKVYLKELQRLQTLANEIDNRDSNIIVPPPIVRVPLAPDIDEPIMPEPSGSTTVSLDDARKKRLYIHDLRIDAPILPACARKTVIELLVHFEQKLLGENIPSQSQETMNSTLKKLKDQVKREELLSDDVKSTLQNLEMSSTNEKYSDIARYSNELLKKFRSLNVSEIQRLVGKAAEAAELIQNKEVVLLIGTTGAGKSTTIQFLAGAKMEEVQVEIGPGKFLEHVTAVGASNNPDLKNVISSPLQKSETRYIAPVTVQLKDILGDHESGVITFCDAPGFGDTAGPEVDIANSIGVIEALKRTKSVKLLALLSLKDLGSRGQGVQKLAHILISMVHGIEDKLDAIVYAFTKFSPSTDINALLLETKKSKVDEDVILQSDTAFVSVLMDMIEKTEDGAIKIEPTKDYPKKFLRKLKNVRGIKNPAEVFRFSMSEETRASIFDHVQRDKFSIICAMKYKDIDLILYYLNDLQILKNLLKETFIQDGYEESIRFVSESIGNYFAEIKEKFNRVLASQDGLQSKDILDYRTSIEYLEHAQKLKEHLESSLISPASMPQNVISELNEINRNLNEAELHSSLVTIYLQNLSELKNSFAELQDFYNSNCEIFQKRFDELVQTARELIPSHDFKKIAEVFFNVLQSTHVLQNHLAGKVQEAYGDIIKSLLRYLNSFSEKAELLLVKVRLSQEEVETIKNYMEILRSAKDNAALQERVSQYLEMLRKTAENSDNHDSVRENIKDLNEICDEYIGKILKHFDEINLRIQELFEKGGENTLENIKTRINDMDALRTISQIELKTAGTYYRTVENIRRYTEQLKADAEKLIIAFDQQTGITNYKQLARSLARLKSADWINQIIPGTYDNLMQRITEELSQYAFQLESSSLKIDLSLKYPENIPTAMEIVEKIESMRDLERSVPELEKHRKAIVERFVQCTQAVFDRIQKTFDLEDKDVYQIKQKLKELEEIKRQYESLHPACILLRNKGYINITILNNEIEEVKAEQTKAREAEKAVECEKEEKLNQLKTVIRENTNIAHSQTSRNANKNAQANAYLQKLGYDRIESVYEQILKIERNHPNDMQHLQDETNAVSVTLHGLESIKRDHESLLSNRQVSPEEITFLREKRFSSYELLDEAIQEKAKVINERGKIRQVYHFTDRLEASAANSAIVYIIQCEKIGHDSVRGNAIDAREKLKEYIQAYGVFLQQEINKKFIHTRSVDSEGGPFMYSQDLEMRLQELSSFNKYSHVFACINGAETVEKWHQEFLDFHRNLTAKMEEYKVADKLKELKDQLMIAQALTCVDRFCASIFAGNGFGVLYRQYQGAINIECRVAYKTVLGHISTGDYANADMAISDIEDNPLNPRDKAQIVNDLYCSLTKLMKDTKSVAFWLDGKIERENNRDQITKIKENTDKIRIACSKHSIMSLLNDTTQKSLGGFDNEISEILAGIILRGLNSIEAFMKADSFSEAEQGMENLSQVQRELAGYCISESVKKKGDELRGKLDGIVSEVMERNEFSDITQFSVNPPKELLVKLKTVAAHGSARFTEAYNSMLRKTRQTVSKAIEDARKAPLSDRYRRICSLTYAICFLPEDLQKEFNLQIEGLSKLINDEEKKYKDDLDSLLGNLDDNEHAIAQIGILAELYSKQNMHDLLKTLREQCIQKLHKYGTSAQESLEEQNIPSTIDIVMKLLKYEEHVGAYIPEIKGILENIRVLVKKKFSSCCETLGNMSSIEQTLIVGKAFGDMLVYLQFSNTSEKRVEEIFPADVMQTAREALQCMSGYFLDNSKHFQAALKDINALEIQRTMLISKKWQHVLEKIVQCPLNHSLVNNLLREMKGAIAFQGMISELEQLVDSLRNQLNVELINKETTQYEGKRDELFNNLINSFNTIKTISTKLRDFLSSPIDIVTVEKEIKMKVEKIRSQLMSRASKSELTSTDADEFRMYYNHLVSFDKYFRFDTIDIQQILDESRDKIFAKVELLKQAVDKSITDVAAVSAALAKIKFLAENLSMFERHITDQIDGVLKRYKASQGNISIISLSVELEKTDEGARLISENSTLSGEDWKKRREKMQKQDDIEYALEKLTGTNLGKDILRKRYYDFKKKYDELLATYLKILTQNDKKGPDLEQLVTQTKSLVSTVNITLNSLTWTRPFKDDLPILVAHIFAVWTLKNTQHYNSMRGIAEANSYLLMPHVGQIIAIFRLLGLGYDTHAKVPVMGIKLPFTGKISDDLVNNLVEVGTGEGKSVVMAITACVFALTGVDVNCSCYSEVLSTRDKNDFASVFRALGIEKRIEYGTFNKLCEQLLNEQCNVRETVRDMIVTNKSAVAVINTSERISPKVLLIDEVDVFLSDKYYGGVYIPSVYLKDDSIKALLDSIWQNKTLKSLNSVKALPAYQTCAIKYSNWMFLFDEAIKDMIAALKSYQSSTYIVQKEKDKIVYVHGESIVDNVVFGYDTVWAYYYENEKGNISPAGLKENVGILINCGRFSYAEMPHEFAYIGGVTGTLKTLAEVETKILDKVYSINKTTFMPSVFGENNRTFNSMNDVRVVKESDYFMEICGEIRSGCNANRAILVFFESQKKLENFHESTELSNMNQEVQIITEKVSVKDRDLYIKRAATLGKVTLLTRTFGRGTDFICRNQQLLVNGGIHVVQTFFSEELSEEYQIMGRGARQGDKGSYRMILQDKDLEWILGSSWREEIPKIKGTILYDTLYKTRTAIYESKCGSKELSINQCANDHQASKKFMTALTSGDIEAVKDFLTEQNKGANLITGSSRTVLLMDATGSMANLLSAAKDTVCTMFQRASTVLSDTGLPSDGFQIQFVVYRDYDCKEDGILQSSAWETNPDKLRNFMTKITAMGGGDYEEAIEIGLWHAVQESEYSDGISQVILIGDAPAKETPAIKRDRAATGGEVHWSKTKYKTPTHYMTELQKLKEKNIPVHTFYLADGAKGNFQKIATETSGSCKSLNINSAQGAESLIHLVTQEVLKKTAGDRASIVLKKYKERYITFTS